MNSGRFVSGWCLSVVLLAGCGSSGPELATVSGVVTMDGAPLKHAFVTFVPEAGRPSFGGTDDNGHYELVYTNDRNGAIAGSHTVRVSTKRASDPENGTKAQPEIVPKKFNTQSQLKKSVEPGANVIDVELTSK